MASEDLFDFSEDIIPSTLEQINEQEDIDIEIEAESGERVEPEENSEIENVDTSIDPNLNLSESALNESNINEDSTIKEVSQLVKVRKPAEPKQIQLPLSKIRSIMKLDPDLTIASTEAVFAVTKATEMFIDSLAKESYLFTNQAKKKTIQKRDVTLAISSVDSLIFLEGAMDT